jgi:putative AlgH/UPF0301 family transcriptional regulator
MESEKGQFGPGNVFELQARRNGSGGIRRSRLGRETGFLLACLLLGLIAIPARAAERKEKRLLFLVARSQIRDPYFEHSVVLMLPLVDTPIEVGLILNKTAPVPLGKLFPESPGLANRTQLTHFGGPVDVHVPGLIFHSFTVPPHALLLYGDVYLNFDSDAISTMLQNPQSSSKMLFFLGRAQWAPEQLDYEVHRGDWYKMHEDGDLIFTSDPQMLWRTLHSRAAPDKYLKSDLPSDGPDAVRQGGDVE